MPFDGNGNFNRVFQWVQDRINGINITASRVDQEDNGFAAGLSNCVTRDGQGKPNADLTPLSGNAFNLGTVAAAWKSLNGIPLNDSGFPALGTAATPWHSINGVPLPQNASSILAYYPQTAAETAAAVTPTNFVYPELNVLRYGADPTGVADSTAAFNQAVSVAVAKASWAAHPGLTFNARIYVPTGWFLVGSTGTFISYGAKPVLWAGDGPQASMIINGSTNQPAIAVSGGGGQFYGGFDGLGFGQASGVTAVAGNCALSITNYTEFFIRNLGIYNFPSAPYEGLVMVNCQQYKVSDVEVQGATFNNIRLQTGGYGTWTDVQSDDAGVGGTGAGWALNNAVKLYMCNCTSFGCFSDGWSLNSTSPSTNPNLNCEFVNCCGDSSQGHNWNIGDAVACSFTNCWGSSQKTNVAGNATKCGFLINGSNVHDDTFTACTAVNNNQDGFQIAGSPHTLSFYNCLAGQSGTGNGVGTGGGYGWNVSSTASAIRIVGGQVESNVTGQVNFNGNNRYANDVIIRDVLGFTSTNHNTSAVVVGTSSIVVNHGLSGGLTPDDVLIAPTSSQAASGISSWWLSAFNSTSFTVNTNVNVATQNWTFNWRATLNET